MGWACCLPIYFCRNIRIHVFKFWSSIRKDRETTAWSFLLLQATSVFEVEEDCSDDAVGMRFKVRSLARLRMWGVETGWGCQW